MQAPSHVEMCILEELFAIVPDAGRSSDIVGSDDIGLDDGQLVRVVRLVHLHPKLRRWGEIQSPPLLHCRPFRGSLSRPNQRPPDMQHCPVSRGRWRSGRSLILQNQAVHAVQRRSLPGERYPQKNIFQFSNEFLVNTHYRAQNVWFVLAYH